MGRATVQSLGRGVGSQEQWVQGNEARGGSELRRDRRQDQRSSHRGGEASVRVGHPHPSMLRTDGKVFMCVCVFPTVCPRGLHAVCLWGSVCLLRVRVSVGATCAYCMSVCPRGYVCLLCIHVSTGATCVHCLSVCPQGYVSVACSCVRGATCAYCVSVCPRGLHVSTACPCVCGTTCVYCVSMGLCLHVHLRVGVHVFRGNTSLCVHPYVNISM